MMLRNSGHGGNCCCRLFAVSSRWAVGAVCAVGHWNIPLFRGAHHQANSRLAGIGIPVAQRRTFRGARLVGRPGGRTAADAIGRRRTFRTLVRLSSGGDRRHQRGSHQRRRIGDLHFSRVGGAPSESRYHRPSSQLGRDGRLIAGQTLDLFARRIAAVLSQEPLACRRDVSYQDRLGRPHAAPHARRIPGTDFDGFRRGFCNGNSDRAVLESATGWSTDRVCYPSAKKCPAVRVCRRCAQESQGRPAANLGSPTAVASKSCAMECEVANRPSLRLRPDAYLPLQTLAMYWSVSGPTQLVGHTCSRFRVTTNCGTTLPAPAICRLPTFWRSMWVAFDRKMGFAIKSNVSAWKNVGPGPRNQFCAPFRSRLALTLLRLMQFRLDAHHGARWRPAPPWSPQKIHASILDLRRLFSRHRARFSQLLFTLERLAKTSPNKILPRQASCASCVKS
jgi:hypothetical protein